VYHKSDSKHSAGQSVSRDPLRRRESNRIQTLFANERILPLLSHHLKVTAAPKHVGAKGKAYGIQGFDQGRLPRLSAGNDPYRHRAASDPRGVGDSHVQLRSMRSN
jgi:hypothetical protein